VEFSSYLAAPDRDYVEALDDIFNVDDFERIDAAHFRRNCCHEYDLLAGKAEIVAVSNDDCRSYQ